MTTCMFLIARCTAIDMNNEYFADGKTIFNVSKGFQAFIGTGMLSALTTTVIGCLLGRTMATSRPLDFLSTRIVSVFIRLCLLLHRTGLMDFAMVCANIVIKLLRFNTDDVYFQKEDE